MSARELWEVIMEEMTLAASHVASTRWPGEVSGQPHEWARAYVAGEVLYIDELPPDASATLLMESLTKLIDELSAYAERYELNLVSPKVHTFPVWSNMDDYSHFPPGMNRTIPPRYIEMDVSAAFRLAELREGEGEVGD